MANVFKPLASKYWVATLKLPGGRRTQRGTGLEDREAALAKAREMEAQENQGQVEQPPKVIDEALKAVSFAGLEKLTNQPSPKAKSGENIDWVADARRWVAGIRYSTGKLVNPDTFVDLMGKTLKKDQRSFARPLVEWLAVWYASNRDSLWNYPQLQTDGWKRRLEYDLHKAEGWNPWAEAFKARVTKAVQTVDYEFESAF